MRRSRRPSSSVCRLTLGTLQRHSVGTESFASAGKTTDVYPAFMYQFKALKVQGHHDISLYNSSLEVYALYPDLIPFLWHKSQYLLFILYVYP